LQKYLKKILRKYDPDLKSIPDYLLVRRPYFVIDRTLKKFKKSKIFEN